MINFSPISFAYADRSAWHAGLYLSQVPLLPKLDFRVEGVYTDVPAGGQIGHGFFYFNFTWRSGYTNNGDLIGSWIGREGCGAQAWTNYWFNARVTGYNSISDIRRSATSLFLVAAH